MKEPTGRQLYIGVARVSTKVQVDVGHSLDTQDEALHVEATRRGVDLEVVLAPARTGRRRSPELVAVLNRLACGEAQGLMVTKIDRLARSVKDTADIMHMAEEQGWNLIITSLGVDLATWQGRLVAQVLAAVAEAEHALISERVTENLAYAKLNGTKTGNPVGRPPTVPADVITRIAKECKAGATPTKIAAGLNADAIPTALGGRQWWPSTVRALLARTATPTL